MRAGGLGCARRLGGSRNTGCLRSSRCARSFRHARSSRHAGHARCRRRKVSPALGTGLVALLHLRATLGAGFFDSCWSETHGLPTFLQKMLPFEEGFLGKSELMASPSRGNPPGDHEACIGFPGGGGSTLPHVEQNISFGLFAAPQNGQTPGLMAGLISPVHFPHPMHV